MRVMWKGAILFGLVSIPVGLYPATEEKAVRFHQLHDADNGRIRYRRVCSLDDEEVSADHIVRGYEYTKDEYVVVSDDDLAALPLESTRAIEIAQFVKLEEIDPVYFQRAYYLVPEKQGIKPYLLLARVLEEENVAAVAKVAFRDKEHLALIRSRDGALVLETMLWPDEIREPTFLEDSPAVTFRDQELAMAKTLVTDLTEPWEPGAYRDEYRTALLELIDRKVAGEEAVAAPAREPAKVVDLMEALRASVEAAQQRKRQAPDGAEEPAATAQGA